MKKTNILTFVLSIIVNVLFILFVKSDILMKIPGFQCESFGCIGLAVVYISISLVILPIIFGIYGAISNKEQKVKQFFLSLFIYLIVTIFTFFTTGIYK